MMGFVGLVIIAAALGSMYTIPIGFLVFGAELVVFHVFTVLTTPPEED